MMTFGNSINLTATVTGTMLTGNVTFKDGNTEIGTVAADCLARAIARGVFEARALPYPNALPGWSDRFGVR